ncbi:peptidoglycan-binding protein [Streptomyces sp. SID12501]|uniref:Peptidoglycan-binding protein n=1 Tax=Streptomyces sp. SID12501 TaxID=2706042 RepID=A0A6B3C7Z4_9ACTN|nr:peptidoglycan-binding protein [Streptomyces sp. SID12501]NEC92536.1 peptidoglycan-binding protein [Streptomyces sp. SID12501]
MADVLPESEREQEWEPDSSGATSGLVRRRRVLAMVAGGAALFAGGGVAASLYVKSPAQAVADTKAPEPDVLTAEVERRVLADTVVLRGTVRAGRTVTVTPSASTSGDGGGGGSVIASKLPYAAGDDVRAGKVVAEVSGRPVITLRGRVAAYRDLKPGSKGDDVTQLQRALADLGYSSGGDATGSFGTGTQDAVERLYADLGYDPRPASTGGEEAAAQAVESAKDSVRNAERMLEDAEAVEKPDTTQVKRAREDLADAREDLATARLQAGAMLPAAEVVFLPAFPARLDAVGAAVGEPVSGVLLTLSSGDLVVQGGAAADEKTLLRKGQKAQILSELTGKEFAGKVATVATTPTASGGQGSGSGSGSSGGSGGSAGDTATYAVVVVPDTALPRSLTGQNVRITVTSAATGGKVLVVPVAAVASGTDGRTTVTVLHGERRERVEVRTGATGDGYVQVTPVSEAGVSGSLDAGDPVVVGTSS